MIESSVTQHASLMGSSTAERVINCPGSVALVARSPKQPPSPAAEKGTACHAVTEHLLLNEKAAPGDFLGAEIAGVTIDQEMHDDIVIAMASAETLLEPFQGDQLVEQVLVHTPGSVFGTADLIALSVDGKDALIADHKFGFVEVKPMSYQGRFLAAAAIGDKALGGMFADAERFHLAIIQPQFEPAHTVYIAPRSEIELFRKTMELAITAAQSPDAPLKIGGWCTYCPAKLVCPAWKEREDHLVNLAKHDKAWALANVAAVLDVWNDARPLVEAAQERAKLELANGRRVPGWRLKPGAWMQNWTNVKTTIAELMGLGFMRDQISEPISPAQLKKLAPYKAVPSIHAAVEELITKSQKAASLARDSDEGAPAIPAAAFARAAQAAKSSR